MPSSLSLVRFWYRHASAACQASTRVVHSIKYHKTTTTGHGREPHGGDRAPGAYLPLCAASQPIHFRRGDLLLIGMCRPVPRCLCGLSPFHMFIHPHRCKQTQEGLTADRNAIEHLVEAVGNDVRQVCKETKEITCGGMTNDKCI